MRQTTGKWNNTSRFVVLMIAGSVVLAVTMVLFMLFGAESVSLADVWNGLFRFDGGNFNHIIVRNIRLPRLLADIIVGVSLSVAGAVMQGNTKNPMADSGRNEVTEWQHFRRTPFIHASSEHAVCG